MTVRNNVTRLLDARKVAYEPVEYDPGTFHSAGEVAEMLGVPPEQVFKTIVVLRDEQAPKAKGSLLAIVPGTREVDLKRLAAGVGAKKLWAAPQRVAERLTGLQVGGISALALLNKGFDVVLDQRAEACAETGIYVSGGQRGLNIRIKPADLIAVTGAVMLEASAEA